MKYILFIGLYFILIANSLFSSILPFYCERMITDFHGVVSDDNSIICYGDYGILTWSQDKGKTWKQSNIGDKYNIYNIELRDGVFYGVTN